MDETVYIALDSRIGETPDWLSDWEKTSMTLTDDGDPVVTYNVYKKDFQADSEVILGKIANSGVVNYVVIAGEKEKISYILGDMDNDGHVDGFDMVLLRKALIHGLADEESQLVADMNGDGAINISDAVSMQKYLLGIE